jgi:hypothetical protein
VKQPVEITVKPSAYKDFEQYWRTISLALGSAKTAMSKELGKVLQFF